MITIVPALILFVGQHTIEVVLVDQVQQEFVLDLVQRTVVLQATHITHLQRLPAVKPAVMEQEPEQITTHVRQKAHQGVAEAPAPHILHLLHLEYKPVSKQNNYRLK